MRLLKTLAALAAAALVAAPAAEAKTAPKKRKTQPGYAKRLTGEATYKSSSTSVSFEAADIGGQRRMPLGTAVSNGAPDKDFDFLRVRLRWHPEMIASTSQLERGGEALVDGAMATASAVEAQAVGDATAEQALELSAP